MIGTGKSVGASVAFSNDLGTTMTAHVHKRFYSAGVILPPQEDTDDFNAWYARAAFLWDINDAVQASLTIVHQEDEGDGDTLTGILDGDTKTSDYEHRQRNLVPFEVENDMVSLDVSVGLGFATLTSATSYVDTDQVLTIDVSGLWAFLSPGLYFGYPADQTIAYDP